MKAEKQTRKQYDESFKRDAVAPVSEQGHKVTDAARRLGLNPNLIYRWKQEFEQEATGTRLTADEREELTRLRRENRQLLMETEILKKRRPTSPSTRGEICVHGEVGKRVSGGSAVPRARGDQKCVLAACRTSPSYSDKI